MYLQQKTSIYTQRKKQNFFVTKLKSVHAESTVEPLDLW